MTNKKISQLGAGPITSLANDMVIETEDAGGASGHTTLGTLKEFLTAGLLDLKGSTDCSSNPNYPVALKGDAYIVSVAGKIGGASGTVVEVGDTFIASADNAGGTQASVGTSWFVLEHNILVTGGTPAGSDTHMQYNDGGVFGADANLKYDDTNKRLRGRHLSLGDADDWDANNVPGDDDHWLEIVNDPDSSILPGTAPGKQFVRFLGYGGNGGYGNNIHFERAGGTETAATAVPDACYLMSIGFRGHNGSAMSASKAAFQVITTQAWTTGANGCKFVWEVTPNGSTTRALAMTLDSTGLTVVGAVKGTRVIGAVSALTDGANIAVNAALGNSFRVTLAGNRTLDNPTNLVDGQSLLFRVKQDATGSRTLAYGSKYKFPGGAPALSTAANALDVISCQYDATDDTLICVLQKAFA